MKLTSKFMLYAAVPVFASGALWALELRGTPQPNYAIAARTSDAARAELKTSTDLEHAFERVAEAIRPSVVSIASTRKLDLPAQFQAPGELFDFGQRAPNLRRFFQRDGGSDDSEGPREHGMGSGVIVSADGYILTNNHVVTESTDLQVRLCDEREFPAKVIGTDPRTDLAVIKIDASGLVPATLGDSDALKVGQWVAAFGSPFGLDQTMSSGIVSAKGRANMHITDFEDFVQTDAAVNPGNSGGPLVDLRGAVVGINTAIVSRSGGSQGIGLAIPSAMAREIMDRLIQDGRVVRGWLGVAIQDTTPELGRSFGFSGAHGVLIGDVTPSSPAQKAGLEPGDIVTAVDGREVASMARFRNQVAETRPGEKLALSVWRDRRTLELDVTIGTAPEGDSAPQSAAQAQSGFGLELSNVTPQLESELNLPSETHGAVVMSVTPDSLAEKAGLRAGDVIVEVDRTQVADARSAADALRSHREEGVTLRVKRDGVTHWVHLAAPTVK